MRKSPDEESGVDWKVLLEDVSFSGIERFLNIRWPDACEAWDRPENVP